MQQPQRYWEIDFARGVAVLLMIIYHFIFDLFFPHYSRFQWLAFLTASIFILVSGISLSISYARGSNFKKFAKRGLKLLLLGAIITIVSFLLLKQGYILFGILHFFGASSFLIYPFLKHSKKTITIFLGISIVLLGIIFSSVSVDFDCLIWLGLTPPAFSTFDFFPILPWFGLLLIGAHIGSMLYPGGKRGFDINDFDNPISKLLQFFGKNSLAIYFVHQSIILLLLYFFGNSEILSLINL